jgi:hypothetical protein
VISRWLSTSQRRAADLHEAHRCASLDLCRIQDAAGWAHRRALAGICGGGPAAIGTKKARRDTFRILFRGKATHATLAASEAQEIVLLTLTAAPRWRRLPFFKDGLAPPATIEHN